MADAYWFIFAVALINLVLLAFALRKLNDGAGILGQIIRDELRQNREEGARHQRDLRVEIAQSIESIQQRFEAFRGSSEQRFDSMRHTVDEKLQSTQDHALRASRELREEIAATLKADADGVGQQLHSFSNTLQTRLESLTGTVERQLKELQEGNTRSLDCIRKTVDEQLQTALDRRLTESFKIVSDNLVSVQKGLGEMQMLATGVGDLKRVLTNVKVRGTWAEFQLGAILEEILTPDQYGKNVQVRPESGERVEFAVKLPGRPESGDSSVWLPIDSKFPQEAYGRLLQAVEASDPLALQSASEQLAQAIKVCAQDICEKYVHPPNTTDFAILFVPTEGLYAEILRIPGFSATLQNKFRVMVAGPTNIAALLSSLRVGFQTLAIERRASEVWTLLRAVKTEFGKFDDVLIKLKRQLERASRTIDATDTRTRAMKRRLHEVELLPGSQASELLSLPATIGIDTTGLDEDGY
jgi:DNA recombination protein RmuC